MAANEISLTIKLDEDDWKAIERAIMTIEKRIERLEAILDARGLDWDHPRVEQEPAKEPEPEHPPDPGEGYRILSKNPPEDLWYRRKIEQPKPPEPEYREPVLPGDVMEQCEFSMTGKDWYEGLLVGFQVDNTHPWISSSLGRWNFARIKKDA